jgi:hypothetical protein
MRTRVRDGIQIVAGTEPEYGTTTVHRSVQVTLVPCPDCGAKTGERCVRADGKKVTAHRVRRVMAIRAEKVRHLAESPAAPVVHPGDGICCVCGGGVPLIAWRSVANLLNVSGIDLVDRVPRLRRHETGGKTVYNTRGGKIICKGSLGIPDRIVV